MTRDRGAPPKIALALVRHLVPSDRRAEAEGDLVELWQLRNQGLYGVLSQIVAQRTRELGIRLALGASPVVVLRHVVGSGVRLTLVGLAIGALASGAASQVIARFVPAIDPPTVASLVVDATVLLAVAILAAWTPAYRASSIDPLTALRTE